MKVENSYSSILYEKPLSSLKIKEVKENFSSILEKALKGDKPNIPSETLDEQVQKYDVQNSSSTSPSVMDNEGGSVQISEKMREGYKICGISDQEIEVFQNIMLRAQRSGGYNNPKDFLRSLSTEEMEILRKVHSLADPIEIEELDTEGAYNLLLPGDMQKDLNNDRFIRVGLALGWTWPPPNAPEWVKKAWEEATSGLSDLEKVLVGGRFMAAEARFNVKYNAKGEIIGFYEPGESGYQNPYAKPGFSYQEFVKEVLSLLEINKNWMKIENYLKNKVVLEKFYKALITNNYE